MTRWLVLGAAGLLGTEVVASIGREHPADPVTAVDRDEVDLTEPAAVARAVAAGVDVVVCCAAWTDVDGAEAHEAAAAAVNGRGVASLAGACADAGVRLLHVSTDYVFDGSADRPYAEEALPAPVTAYGRTKLAGEGAVTAWGGTVVRTAWLHDGPRGRSFVATMGARALSGEPSVVVADQRGQPTWVRPLAERLVALGGVPGPLPPVLHATCAGETTWYDLAREVYRLSGADPGLVTPTTTAAVARPARRPAYSVLADTRSGALGLPPMPGWQPALTRAMEG